MAFGLRLWNASGTLVFSESSRLPRYFDTVDTGTSSGSASDARLTEGTAFYSIQYPTDFNPVIHIQPTISISGSTISWTFYDNSSLNRSVKLVWGAY